MPLGDIDRAQEAPPDKEAEIVIYRMNTVRPASEEAARQSAAKGYTNFRDYAEGKRPSDVDPPYEANQ